MVMAVGTAGHLPECETEDMFNAMKRLVQAAHRRLEPSQEHQQGLQLHNCCPPSLSSGSSKVTHRDSSAYGSAWAGSRTEDR